MTESFLHYLWQFQYFDKKELCTAHGEPLQVLHPGHRNTHAGPDFFSARVRMGAIEWVGSVEIHIHASGWLEHKHNEDKAYENVVLHVVWHNDKPVRRDDGTFLPALELKHRVDEALLFSFKKLIYNPEEIPCAAQLDRVNEITKISMLDRALMQRLENKARIVTALLQRNANNWEETCYQWLARNFGFKVNADPFQQLARATPYKLLLKHADHLVQLEALLFGQAGFLETDEADHYHQLLKREHRLLSHKYQLHEKMLKKAQWKFLRLRPANFPTLRIAQLAALLHHRQQFFAILMEADSLKKITDLFSISQSAYWLKHYQFVKPAKEPVSTLGETSIENIIINTVAPLLVAYGKSKDDLLYVERAVTLLQNVHAESNTIIRQWKSAGIPCKTAFDSQALVELYNNFCLKRRCLECAIGASLVNPRRSLMNL